MYSEKVRFRNRKSRKRGLANVETTNPYYTEWYLEITPEIGKCVSCDVKFVLREYCPCCGKAYPLQTVNVSPSIQNLRNVLLNVILHNGELRKDTDEKEQLLRLMEFHETLEKAMHLFIERTYGYKIKRRR
jgi:hypothetical protein